MSDQVDVGPSVPQPTHHLSLTDGVTTLGFILCDRNGNPTNLPIQETGAPSTVTRISQGAGGYGDFEQPYTPVVQGDWSGGRGQEDFESDVTRYADGYRANTISRDILPGPKDTKALANPNDITGSQNGSWVLIFDGTAPGLFTKFTANFTGSIRNVRVNFSRSADAPDWEDRYLTAQQYTDVAGAPGVLVAGSSVECPQTAMPNTPFDIPVNFSVVSGTSYWLKMGGPYIDASLLYNSAAAGKRLYRSDGVTYINNAELYFVLSGVKTGTNKFFEYRHSLMCVQNHDSQAAPLMYMNGYHLMALAPTNRAESVVTLTLASDTLAGAIIKVVAGPGATEEQNWRKIVSSTQDGGARVIRVETPWEMNHTAATEYAIVGLDTWTLVTGHTLSSSVTDILVVNDIVYFALGEDKTIVRARWNAGAWSFAYEGADSVTGNKATQLELIPDSTGKQRIWRTLAVTCKASCADVAAWGTNLVFGTEIVCGSTSERITGLIGYGSPMVPWILKEGSFGSIGGTSATSPGSYAQVPLSEMATVRSEENGRAAAQYGVYLFFSLGEGVERYYEGKLDDMGPNRDMGLPSNRRGTVRQMIAAPNGIFAVVDARARKYGEVYSSVLFWNQTGWSEVYRGPAWGSIRNIFIQNIPGATCDRLWISTDVEIVWVPWTMYPLTQEDYEFVDYCEIEGSWISGSMRDISKYWAAAKLFSENLYYDPVPGFEYQSVQLYTQTDDGGWELQGRFTESPSQEIVFPVDVTGKRLKYKLAIHNTQYSAGYPTRIKQLLFDAVTRIPPKSLWTVTFFVADEWVNLNNDELTEAANTFMAQLKTWTDSRQRAAPLTMHHNHVLYDGIKVFIEPASIQPIELVVTPDRSVKLLGRMTLRQA